MIASINTRLLPTPARRKFLHYTTFRRNLRSAVPVQFQPRLNRGTH